MIYETLIDAQALATLIGTDAVVCVDCRFDLAAPAAGRAAFRQARIPGAAYADLNLDLSGPVTTQSGRHPLPGREALGRFLANVGVTAETQVIAYDAGNGAFAARLWWLLRWLGHAKVAVLDGGFAAWVESGGTVEAGDSVATRAAARSGLGGGLSEGAGVGVGVDERGTPAMTTAWVTSEEVAAATTSPSGDAGPRMVLVDARAPERFAGRVEPLDPVAGHVPSARNFPFTGNLGPGGRFLPADELRRRWREFLGDADPANVVAMCGSGVTACHNLLALEVAGLRGAKLYAGSWSEWIRNPTRGIATGTGT
jgi:thiosulfate/3-mercaptopyruvate sulfurtransferase